jgi:lipopolysaccharide biosynthesis protein
MNTKARVIAFYLPQFHPIPENDKWWGEGFTEWTNVRKAKPLFKGHYQPRVPADLGYYDLRMPEVREQQAQMAKEAGIEGFCYWHYWFGNGKQLLERPFQEVLETGKPDFPFCLGWANHSWTNKTWEAGKKFVTEGILMEQVYSEEDYIKHFHALLPAFKDRRYIRVENKPLFVVYAPYDIPNSYFLISKWNELAKQNGLEGVHFAGLRDSFRIKTVIKEKKSWNNIFHFNDVSYFFNDILKMGFDAVISTGHQRAQAKSSNLLFYASRRFFLRKIHIHNVKKYQYREIIKNYYTKEDAWENVYPTIIPNRDRTPRSGKAADIWHGSTPELFKEHVINALEVIKNKKEEHKILFLQSWNEWGEGNYVEPDIVFGKRYLQTLNHVISK